ncbi:hypothetical protein BB778_18890 [Pluralibacter gergoviae]|nr:hypothetical protein BB778_18890 [Pluralibacter gergoviae]
MLGIETSILSELCLPEKWQPIRVMEKKYTFKRWLKVCSAITSFFVADNFLALHYQFRGPDLLFQ